MPLFKKLIPVGNSLGLILDRPVLSLVGIDRDTTLEVSTEAGAIVIRPANGAYLDRVRESARKVMKTHRATLKKLADR